MGGNRYFAGTIDAFTQLHIVRRLAPCLGRLAALLGPEERESLESGDPEAALVSLAAAASELSDEDVEYIVNACLDATERRQPGGGPAALRANGVTMFTLNLPELLCISYRVLKANLADFSAALPSDFDGRGLKPDANGSAFRVGKSSS